MTTPRHNPDNGITALLVAAGEVQSHLNSLTASQASPPGLAEKLRRMSETLTAHLCDIPNRVSSLAERVDIVEKRPSPPLNTPNTSGSKSRPPKASPSEGSAIYWADSDPHERFVPDLNEILTWPDGGDDAEQGCSLFHVSMEIESLLRDAFTKTVPN